MDQEYIKDFHLWDEYKRKIDARKIDFEFSEREIWWCSLGVNIGIEQDGKGTDFLRPVLVLKKVSKEGALVVPSTTSLKKGLVDRLDLMIAGENDQLILSQIRLVSSKRFFRRITKIDSATFLMILIRLVRYLLHTRLD